MHAFEKSFDRVKLLVIDFVGGCSFTPGDQPLTGNLYALKTLEALETNL